MKGEPFALRIGRAGWGRNEEFATFDDGSSRKCRKCVDFGHIGKYRLIRTFVFVNLRFPAGTLPNRPIALSWRVMRMCDLIFDSEKGGFS